jgi:carbon storage regulator
MLCLTRKIGQSIHIANSVVLTVVAVKKGQVRLAFRAPREVPIHREELKPRPAEPPQ